MGRVKDALKLLNRSIVLSKNRCRFWADAVKLVSREYRVDYAYAFHHPMSSGSRYVRLILGEYDVEAELIEERPWSRRKEFLALNPAATLPVLLAERDLPVVGATVIAEYLDETRGALKRSRRLLPESPMERAEVRRLVDWFLLKFENEVTRHIARERVFKLQMADEMGAARPIRQLFAQPAPIFASI